MSGEQSGDSVAPVVFPWNEAIDLTSYGSDQRATVICLAAVHESVEALRQEMASYFAESASSGEDQS